MPDKQIIYYYPEINRDGPSGSKGIKGNKGNIGLTGDIGPIGKDGPQGIKGDFGKIGNKGNKGNKGEIGPIGRSGQKGDKGDSGINGNKIINHYVQNSNLYLKLSDNNIIGPIEKLSGPKGNKGNKGEHGKNGIKGEKGKKGYKGNKGDDGLSIVNIYVNSDNKLTFLLSDNTTITTNDTLILDNKMNIDENLFNIYYNLGFYTDKFNVIVPLTESKNERYYISDYTKIDYTKKSSKLHLFENNQNIFLKEVFYNNYDENFKELFKDNNYNNNLNSIIGSEWSVDPFPIYSDDKFFFENELYSGGHIIIPSGININKKSYCQEFNLFIDYNILNNKKGYYLVNNDYNPENINENKLKSTSNIKDVPNYLDKFFGNISINRDNNLKAFISLKVFVRFELHYQNNFIDNIKYAYLDSLNNYRYDNLDIKSSQSAAFTLRSYSNWLGIGDNNKYNITDNNIWNYRKKHPIYQKGITDFKFKRYTDESKKNYMYPGDTLCIKISFSNPDKLFRNINSNGYINDYSNNKDIIDDIINLNNGNDIIKNIINCPDNHQIYWPGILNANFEINKFNLSLNIKNIDD